MKQMTPAILMTYLIDFKLDGSKAVMKDAQDMTRKEILGQVKSDLEAIKILHEDPNDETLLTYQGAIEDLEKMEDDEFETIKADIISANQISAEEEAQALQEFLYQSELSD